MAKLNGPVFGQLQAQFNTLPNPQPISGQLLTVCNNTVDHLLAGTTGDDTPGMLLGRIQSGKTKAFIGVLAIALDNGYDHVVIFTKGTKALARQTVARLRRDLRLAIDQELVNVFDVMNVPDSLSPWELSRKLVLVCKKEDDNLLRLTDILTETYPDLANKRILIIDDEADLATVGYRRTAGVVIPNVIPSQMNDLRDSLTNASFLMVTATPNSLYLQPEGEITIPATGMVLRPVRPAFTELVPAHGAYVGGDVYFEQSLDPNNVAWHLHVEIEEAELMTLKRTGSVNLEEVLSSSAIQGLRKAIVTFVVGGIVRRWQQQQIGESPKRYSFIMHTDATNAAHRWQNQLVGAIVERMRADVVSNMASLEPLLNEAYEDLSESVAIAGTTMPTMDQVVAQLPTILDGTQSLTVNREAEIDQLLDDNGQLQLRNPLNVFIGGNILDRGITIDNVLGFLYGRNPQRSQQDTVLQHARMYGARPPEDLAVTRFYTTADLYDRLDRIHQMDSALRTALETTGHNQGVVFLPRDPQGSIQPCSPNKILLSNVMTLRPGRTLVPFGFTTTTSAAHAKAAIEAILAKSNSVLTQDSTQSMYMLAVEEVREIIDQVEVSLQMDPGREFDFQAMRSAFTYLASSNTASGEQGQIACLVKRGTNLGKIRTNGRLQNAPATGHEKGAVQPIRGSRPVLFLIEVNGGTNEQWNGQPFYWPVLMAPDGIQPLIFTAETGD